MSSSEIKATKEDLDLIQEALDYVRRGDLDYVFKSMEAFEDLLIFTFDDDNVYKFNLDNKDGHITTSHNLELDWEVKPSSGQPHI